MEILLDLIDDPPVCLRGVNKHSVAYAELKDSMSSLKQLNSILCRPVGDRYQRVDGGHRVCVARELGWTHIHAIIREMDDNDLMVCQLVNSQRVPTERVEYAKHLMRIKNSSPDMTLPEISKLIGKSATWVKDQLRLLKLHSRVAIHVSRGDISLSNSYQLAKLPTHQQLRHLNKAVSMSTAEFRAFISQLVINLMVASKDRKAAARLEASEFKPHLYFRCFPEIESELRRGVAGAELIASQQPTNMIEAFKLGVQWSTNVDPVSIAHRKEVHAEKQLPEIKSE